jgi:mannan endo-1,4-beta-mannosidase
MKVTRITGPQLFIVIILLALIIIDKGCIPQLSSSILSTRISSNGFVTRRGSQLMLNGHPFRFAGANMHWLPFGDSTKYTSQFEINDGLDAAKEMGLTVVRSHDLGISVGCSNCIEPALGAFNETALEHDDYVIKAARDHGIRLIIPLTDNYHYPAGGKHTFTDWRGIFDENQFYYNPQVIQDFETYISVLLDHVNVYTGIAYKNDPTIMAWETGNELFPPTNWTQTISTYIKSIDRNHLVLDGHYGVDPNAASLTNVDIVSNHYYPKNDLKVTLDATAARKIGKVFIVGEFDWNDANGGDPLSNFLSAIESNSAVAGDLFWELWPHDDHYGYVHGEVQYILHYPGDAAAMRASTRQLRMHAYNMRDLATPEDSIPGTPLLEVVTREGTENVLIWRGAAKASSYTIERSTISAKGPWTVICDRCATDDDIPWVDIAPPPDLLSYRVIANNLFGRAGLPSNPYQAGSASMVLDNLNDWSKT